LTLRFATRLLLFAFLFFGGLYFAKGFLVPIAFGGVLAMLLLPLAAWLEGKGWGKGWATASAVTIFLLGVAGIFALLGVGIKSLASDLGNIEQKLGSTVSSAQGWISEKIGIGGGGEQGDGDSSKSGGAASADSTKSSGQQGSASGQDTAGSGSKQSNTAAQQTASSSGSDSSKPATGAVSGGSSGGKSSGGSMGERLKSGLGGGGGGLSQTVQKLPAAVLSFLADALITLVYTFLFLRFRIHLKRFALKLVPEPDRRTALEVMHEASSCTQRYLAGMGGMIVCLWVMYGIGFSIAGVKGALFFAVLCGTLELVPFVGNLAGTAVTLLVSLAQSGGSGGKVALGILATYVVVQGIQSYLLEPLVVGRQVKLHPMFTILVIVLGETVWGIPGMILAVPLLGIAKIIADRVPALQPYGYLFGEQENANDASWKERVRAKLGRIFPRRRREY